MVTLILSAFWKIIKKSFLLAQENLETLGFVWNLSEYREPDLIKVIPLSKDDGNENKMEYDIIIIIIIILNVI